MIASQSSGSPRACPAKPWRSGVPRTLSGVLAGHIPSFSPPCLLMLHVSCMLTPPRQHKNAESVLSFSPRLERSDYPGLRVSNIKARCPAYAGRREARSAGTSASLSASRLVFKIKTPSQTVKKTLKLTKGQSRVLTPLPPGTPLAQCPTPRAFFQKPFISYISSPFTLQFWIAIYPQKHAIYDPFSSISIYR